MTRAEKARAATGRGAKSGALAAATVPLGAGAAGWALGGARWRAAATGNLDLGPSELALAAAAALLGIWWGATMSGRERSPLLAAAGLVVVAALGLAAVAALPPAVAASPLGGALTQAPVLGGAGVLWGMLAHEGRRAARAAAFAVLGAAAWTAALPALDGLPAFSVLAVATVLLMLAAALVPGEARGRSEAPDLGAAAVALPIGTAWALCWERPVASLPEGALPAALTAAAGGVALLAVAAVPVRHRARAAAIAVAALVVAFDPDAAQRCEGTSAVALVILPLAGLAIALCGGFVPALALLGLGAASGAASSLLGAPAGAVAAGAGAVALVTLVRRSALAWLALAVAVGSEIGDVLRPPAPSCRSGEQVLARAGAGAAVYRPRRQELAIAVAGRDLDVAGPDHPHAVLVAALARVLAPAGGVAVVGSGTGRIRSVLEGSAAAFTVVEPCAATAALQPFLAVDRPVASRAPAGTPWRAGTREFAWSLAPGSCAAFLCAEPLSAAAPARAAFEEHAALRAAVGDGLVVQCFLLARTPPALLATALAAATVHPWCGVFLFERTGLLCGLGRSPDLARAAAAIDGLPMPLRWRLHEAGIGSGQDLLDAWLGVAAPATSLRGDDDVLRCSSGPVRSGVDATAQNARALAVALALQEDSLPALRLQAVAGDAAARRRAAERLERAAQRWPEGVLLSREHLRAHRQLAAAAIAATDPLDPGQVAAAAALAVHWRHRGNTAGSAGSDGAVLQAALALPDRRGGRAREPGAAAAAALALDPGFAAEAPAVLAPIVAGLPAHSPLADFASLPEPPRLAALAVGDGALAIALRGRFPSRCAAALVDSFGQGPLPAPALSALRELADAFVLAAAAQALGARAADGELLQIWRPDLPATRAIAALAQGPAAQRQALHVAFAGRADAASLRLLAQGLVDADLSVRTAAGAALFRSIGERIVYDPLWPAERRAAASAQLLALCHQTP